MKKLLAIALTAAAAASCATSYQQITTLMSDNVKLDDGGHYRYENPDLVISYDFWSEYGHVDFLVANNSDKDIYLDLEKSHFVNNGYAFDYYRGTTTIVSSGSTVSEAASSAAAVSGILPEKYNKFGDATNYAVAAGASSSVSFQKNVSVEYPEQKTVCIPAHSFKVFGQFVSVSKAYRECGLPRNPTKKETEQNVAVREFTSANTPLTIENRLVFIIDEKEVPVNNVFFAVSFRNISLDDALLKDQKSENCDGTTDRYDVHKFASSNRFYIKYSDVSDLSSDRDHSHSTIWRASSSHGKTTRTRFSDR